MATIEVDGCNAEVPDGASVKEALESLGFEAEMFPADEGIFMPCQMGGCWACAMEIDGMLQPLCVSAVHHGMRIKTDSSSLEPKRIVGGFMGHRAGGVGTPWWLKGDYIEVACFAAGCNFCCPQCQNWQYTYLCTCEALTPKEAAKQMTDLRAGFGVDRIAISGGECTLNRRWLLEFLRDLRNRNPGAHLHIDTNGSILTGEYIDDLVEAGMTDIGIDLKALMMDTFQTITGIVDEPLAKRYLATAWEAVEYLHENHPWIFLGIGIPYNKGLIGLEEIAEIGSKIAGIDPWLQVCALDYHPEFRRQDLVRPSYWEMFQVYGVLRDAGLLSVICQTDRGRIGPDGRLLT